MLAYGYDASRKSVHIDQTAMSVIVCRRLSPSNSKCLHDVSGPVMEDLTLRDIHLAPTIVDYQAVNSLNGCR